MAPSVHVHYFVDATNGLAKLHFSGSSSAANVFIKNKALFNLALIGMQTVPSKDKLWDDKGKTWNIHSDVWITLMPYYSLAPEVYEMHSYISRSQWDAFITGKVARSSTGAPASEAEAAAQFFGAQSFNHAIYATATAQSERDDFVSLMGLNNWGQFDSLANGEAKKLYRSAALKLHPDRNNGDGTQMSRLNELWRIYGGSK